MFLQGRCALLSQAIWCCLAKQFGVPASLLAARPRLLALPRCLQIDAAVGAAAAGSGGSSGRGSGSGSGAGEEAEEEAVQRKRAMFQGDILHKVRFGGGIFGIFSSRREASSQFSLPAPQRAPGAHLCQAKWVVPEMSRLPAW